MSNLIDVPFIIPEVISKGLATGVYERVGGVIRQTRDKKIVFWLKEGGSVLTKGRSIIVTLTSLGKATLAFSDFFYMYDNFKTIKEQLNTINLKLDSQNLSKIQTGFALAKEAELMSDFNSANTQIIGSRALLEEGSNIFKNLFENIKKKDKQDSFVSFDLLKLLIVSQLGIIRTYLYQNEYQLARKRLLELKSIVLNESLHYIKRQCRDDVPWYIWAAMFTVALPATAGLFIYGAVKKDKEDWLDTEGSKVLKKIAKLEKANEQEEKILERIIRITGRRQVELPTESKSLLNFRDFIDGYLLETEKLNKSKKQFRDALKELPTHQGNDLLKDENR